MRRLEICSCGCINDEDAEAYLNGIPAARVSGYTTDYEEAPISPDARAALKPGKNVVAVHCHQTAAGNTLMWASRRLSRRRSETGRCHTPTNMKTQKLLRLTNTLALAAFASAGWPSRRCACKRLE